MAHKTMVDGTAYDIKGGRTMVDGTAYGIQKGKTMVDGTAYELKFSSPVKVTISGSNTYVKAAGIKIDGTEYTSAGSWTFDSVGEIAAGTGSMTTLVYLKEDYVGTSYSFAPTTATVTIAVGRSGMSTTIKITTK